MHRNVVRSLLWILAVASIYSVLNYASRFLSLGGADQGSRILILTADEYRVGFSITNPHDDIRDTTIVKKLWKQENELRNEKQPVRFCWKVQNLLGMKVLDYNGDTIDWHVGSTSSDGPYDTFLYADESFFAWPLVPYYISWEIESKGAFVNDEVKVVLTANRNDGYGWFVVRDALGVLSIFTLLIITVIVGTIAQRLKSDA